MEQQTLVDITPAKSTKDQMVRLQMIKEKIDFLYDQQTELVKEMLGSSEKFIDHIYIDGLDKPWMRITLTDNMNVFKENNAVFRMATINRYESKVEFLKNEPKEK
jgi:hypothetical protein